MTPLRFAAELLQQEAERKKREQLEMVRHQAAAGDPEAKYKTDKAPRSKGESGTRLLGQISRGTPASRLRRPAPVPPGGTPRKAARRNEAPTTETARLEKAIAAATGCPRRPLDHAETIDARAIGALAEAFEVAAGRVADPVAILRVRLRATRDFLARIGDAHQPRAAELMAGLRTLRFDLGTLVNQLDELLEAKERNAPVLAWPAPDDEPPGADREHRR